MPDELEIAWKNAYSIENMAAHGAAGRQINYIGTVERGTRLYLFYRDSSGAYWFKNHIKTDRGIVPEYEGIFGKPERKKQHKK